MKRDKLSKDKKIHEHLCVKELSAYYITVLKKASFVQRFSQRKDNIHVNLKFEN